MAQAVVRTRTTRFEILASPDSITGDWRSASEAILQQRGPLEQVHEPITDPAPPHFPVDSQRSSHPSRRRFLNLAAVTTRSTSRPRWSKCGLRVLRFIPDLARRPVPLASPQPGRRPLAVMLAQT